MGIREPYGVQAIDSLSDPRFNIFGRGSAENNEAKF